MFPPLPRGGLGWGVQTGCILKKVGLVKPRKHRQWIPPYPNALTRSSQPNDVWNIDFKGQGACKPCPRFKM
ncbi:hypothetical protein [Celerinatantimonas sp. YJH-8]|uniref:hypothetical protein n=1 Tax=Celerinatantimonas sp. YJH-8 TaxID=3228714 RepID=UPI0038C33AFC